MQIKFYKSADGDEAVIKVFDADASADSLDGLVELKPGSTDGAVEKHVPAVEVDGDIVHVNIGSADHPMLPEHYIQFICLVTEHAYEIHALEPGNAPHADFRISQGDKPIAVYEYCNVHGLWVKELAASM